MARSRPAEPSLGSRVGSGKWQIVPRAPLGVPGGALRFGEHRWNAVNDIPTSPGFKQVALSVTFADEKGSVLHRMDFSTRVQAQPSEPIELTRNRAVEQAKGLANEFARS